MLILSDVFKKIILRTPILGKCMRLVNKLRKLFNEDIPYLRASFDAQNRQFMALDSKIKDLAVLIASVNDTLMQRMDAISTFSTSKVKQLEDSNSELLQQMERFSNESAHKVTELIGLINQRFDEVINARDQIRDQVLSRMDSAKNAIIDNGHKTINSITVNSAHILNNQASILSYCFNSTHVLQGELENSSRYKYFRSIHDLLKIYDVVDGKKVRIGKKNDGGYVMIEPFSTSKIAYSFGISNDVSWDLEMASHGYEIYQYDHTITKLPQEHPAFHWQKLGLTGLMETNDLKNLATLIHAMGHDDLDGILLKMDIEGYEWDVFSDVSPELLKKFDQIVIEVHDLANLHNSNLKFKALSNILEYFAPVHVHGNNYRYAIFSGNLITPDVLEITFVSKAKYILRKSTAIFPVDIDQENHKGYQDIYLGKW